MSEIKWFVQVVTDFRGDAREGGQRPIFFMLRAHSWQDAFDSIRKDQFADLVWALYALEKNGTYFAGDGFRPVDPGTLRQSGFVSELGT